MSYVIAVAGPVGSGKSSLAGALVRQLGDAAMVRFDHYEDITRKTRGELVQWMQDGADIDRFAFPDLVRDLDKLKRGEAVEDPVTHEIVEPQKYIVFEMPFGKAHAATAPFVDRLLWIDIPLDIALARKLREYAGAFLNEPPDRQQGSLIWLYGYVDSYLAFVHDILQVQHDKVRPGADLLLDGLTEPDSMSMAAEKFVRSELP